MADAEMSTEPKGMKRKISINEFYQSIQAVFGPCAIWAKNGEQVISRGWTPIEGAEFPAIPWETKGLK